MSACWPSRPPIALTPAGLPRSAPANAALFMRVHTSSVYSPMCRRIAALSVCSTDIRQHWPGSAQSPVIACGHSASSISARPVRWPIFIGTMESMRMPSSRRRRRSHPAARSGTSRRCLEPALHHRANSEQQYRNRKDDNPDDDRAHDDSNRVDQRIARRRAHQRADAGVQQVQAVKAEDRQEAQRRKNIEHAGKPGRRRRIGRYFHGACEILAGTKRASEEIDDVADKEKADQRQYVNNDGTKEPKANSDALAPDADNRCADKSTNWRNGSNNRNIVGKKIAGVARLGIDLRPFRLRLQQDPLDSVHEIHDTPPFIRDRL